jgi:hypothetical protein
MDDHWLDNLYLELKTLRDEYNNLKNNVDVLTTFGFDGFDQHTGHCYFCINKFAFEHNTDCAWQRLVST